MTGQKLVNFHSSPSPLGVGFKAPLKHFHRTKAPSFPSIKKRVEDNVGNSAYASENLGVFLSIF